MRDLEFWQTLLITFKLASITTAILLIIGIPIAYFLAYSKNRLKPVFEALVSMPLVLPPTVIGFYFLLFFGSNSLLGVFLQETFGLKLVFTFEGLVIGSLIYSFPFMIQPIQAGFEKLPEDLLEASYLLGKSKFETLLHVQLPNIRPNILSGLVLTFAHTVGEFGVILMIGGNIPGKTRVASIAIYNEVEAMAYQFAHYYAGVLIGFSFLILLLVYLANKRMFKLSR